jgi:hypothetical protein
MLTVQYLTGANDLGLYDGCNSNEHVYRFDTLLREKIQAFAFFFLLGTLLGHIQLRLSSSHYTLYTLLELRLHCIV